MTPFDNLTMHEKILFGNAKYTYRCMLLVPLDPGRFALCDYRYNVIASGPAMELLPTIYNYDPKKPEPQRAALPPEQVAELLKGL